METTPRILSPHLSTFQHRTVRLMGIVISMSGQSAILDCGGEVTLILNRDSQFIVGHAVDVIGKVMEDLSVMVMVGDDWGEGNRIGRPFCTRRTC